MTGEGLVVGEALRAPPSLLVDRCLRQRQGRLRQQQLDHADIEAEVDAAVEHIARAVERLRGFKVEEVQQQTMAEALTPEGDALFRQLKDECLARYMSYGDYAREDDIEKVEFEKDDWPAALVATLGAAEPGRAPAPVPATAPTLEI